MKATTILIIVAIVFLVYVALFAQPQMSVQNYVKFLQPSSYQPPTIVILQHTPETVQICAERFEGLTSCRSAADFRLWVQQRKASDDLR